MYKQIARFRVPKVNIREFDTVERGLLHDKINMLINKKYWNSLERSGYNGDKHAGI